MPTSYRLMGIGTFSLTDTEAFREFLRCSSPDCSAWARVDKECETVISVSGENYNVVGYWMFICSEGHKTEINLVNNALAILVEKFGETIHNISPKNLRFSFRAHSTKPIVYAVLSLRARRVKNNFGIVRYVGDQEFKELIFEGSETAVPETRSEKQYTVHRRPFSHHWVL